jgi:hypothetical protein
MIGSVGQPMVVGGWAKQQITNGVSGKFAYLGQYFDKAYKVNTNGAVTTNTTGILSPYGEFLPIEPGPVALVTMPDLTTGQRGTGVVQVIKMQLDVNHDGNMDLTFAGPDNTYADRPFRFWVNNDSDKQSFVGDPGEDALVTTNSQYDYNFPTIPSQRDLEDWARLWICGVPALATNQGYTVTLSMTAISGNPAINLADAVETNGGTLYLTDTNTAIAEVFTNGVVHRSKYPDISPTTPLTLPASLFTNAGNKYFLFEGAGIGQGQLTMTISQNGTNLASTSVFMDLRDVKDMFEHVLITNVRDTTPASYASAYTQVNELVNDPTADKKIIAFVHGWRMGEFEYKSFSETMFKRLYWQAYRGRFVSIRWPTLSKDDFKLPFRDLFTYNRSEFRAFKSGQGVSDYLNFVKQQFPGYSLNVASHSRAGSS